MSRSKQISALINLLWVIYCTVCAQAAGALPLRVASVSAAPRQPQESDKAVIFYDDFSAAPVVDRTRYLEFNANDGSFAWVGDGGIAGGSMRCQFEKGLVSAGSLKVLFGRSPFRRGIRATETFNEIYWRVYVKHERGWEGNPAKLGRTTCLATENWSQGFIAHVWGGKGDALCIDPATGIHDSVRVSTKYNDFDHLHWLGSRQGQIPIFNPVESGRWVCVESHVKLNHPDQADGIFELWVDGKVEGVRTNLDWHGHWNEYGINAVFLENYWNDGSSKRQARWFDNFVISTHLIGPILATQPPVVTRVEPENRTASLWEIEVAADAEGTDIVWRSNAIAGDAASTVVDAGHGSFQGSLSGGSNLATERTYWLRIRRTAETDWSPWHSPFRE